MRSAISSSERPRRRSASACWTGSLTASPRRLSRLPPRGAGIDGVQKPVDGRELAFAVLRAPTTHGVEFCVDQFTLFAAEFRIDQFTHFSHRNDGAHRDSV